MRKLYTLLTLTFLTLLASAQPGNFLLTFEDSAMIAQHYYTDSLLDPAGIWQIGAPHKADLSSAFSPPNAVVTLTDSLVPGGVRASFIISLPQVYLNEYTGGFLTFKHKYDLDTTHGEAYAEFSVDSGVHWHSVRPASERDDCDFHMIMLDGLRFYPPTWWDGLSRNINADSIYYISGSGGGWISDTIGFAPDFYAVKTNQLSLFMLRFTIHTDSTAAPSEGWLLDEIQYTGFQRFCGGAVRELSSAHLLISPNPASGAFQITLTDQQPGDYMVTLTDLTGREVMRRSFSGAEVTLHRDGLAAGSYVVRVVSERTGDSFSRQIVLE